jgi:hypothetical protein
MVDSSRLLKLLMGLIRPTKGRYDFSTDGEFIDK